MHTSKIDETKEQAFHVLSGRPHRFSVKVFLSAQTKDVNHVY